MSNQKLTELIRQMRDFTKRVEDHCDKESAWNVYDEKLHEDARNMLKEIAKYVRTNRS